MSNENPAYGNCQCPCHGNSYGMKHVEPCCTPDEGISCEYNREIICPHCGRTQSEPNEITGDNEDGDTECGWCEKPFRWHRHVEITYSTEKPIRDVTKEDWGSEDKIIFLNGKDKPSFKCPCGCNVFRKHNEKLEYRCNSCGSTFEGEK